MGIRKVFIEQIVYPAMEKLKGNKIRSYLRELKLSQEFTRQMLEELKQERLRKLLKHCIENVPAYRSGKQLRVLQAIEGREDDIFVSKEGKLVHGHLWNHIARNTHGIKQFRLVQHDKERVTLKIVKNEKFKPSLSLPS